uniref:Gag-Pol polyprotein n=1 Tax=Tanacetum cinerariifolium TaxID=118510 RepID=A0A6L2LFD6_TANCI|nr:Gag-Pol polyprotein [Tanacetum cinerariifolium]
MMKGYDIGIQEKKARLFNDWERFNSTEGELIESYYHRFSKLMNDFKGNKHFSEKTANQKVVDDLRVERLAKPQDPLALMAISNNPFSYPVFHLGQPSSSTYIQQPQPNNNYNPQPSFNQNYMQQPMPNPKDITDPATELHNPAKGRDDAYLQTQLLIAQKEEAGIQLQVEEFDLMDSVADNDKIEGVNANCILMANLQQASTSVPQKVDKTHDLSNPVTSNSVPTTKESKVVENDKVIAHGMFKINPFKNSREEKFVPNKPIKARVRTNPITISQPHVITKKVVNSDSNSFSFTGVDITTKIKRPQARRNTKNDKVPSASKSSHIKNKEVKVEEHPRNLLLLRIRNICYPNMFMVHRLGLFQAYDHNLKLLINFVWKSLGTVRFGNDHVAAILGFSDLLIPFTLGFEVFKASSA